MSKLFLDLETYCETPIKNGAHRYAEDAEIMLVAWAWNDEDVVVWDCTVAGWEAFASGLQKAIDEADEVVIHNSAFDRTVLRHRGVNVPLEKITDTMVLALQHSLPGSLGQLCDVVGVPQDKAKDKDGKKLIQLFSKPRPKNVKLRRATRETHPDEWQRFIEYARLDVDAMRSVYGKLPRWNDSDSERDYWRLDQRVNDRGVAVDRELARSAVRAFERATRSLATRAALLTGGAVSSATQRDKLIGYIADAFEYPLDDLRGATVEKTLENAGNLPIELRELLEIRQQAAATSPAKYKALLGAVSSDGRLRGTVQFCGAARTGRDAGRIFQPQNLPRTPDWFDDEVQAITVQAFKDDAEDILWENVSDRCAMSVRGSLIAEPGCKFTIADLSNIEGRVLAWLAGEQWKIEAFKAYDRGEGPDLYKVTAGRILGKDPADITKDERQYMGKVPELACLGPDTRVLTNNGVKAITKVDVNDLLWDGEEWVKHEGLIDRGSRYTIMLKGLEVTPDHELLVGQTWLSAQTVASCPNTLDHALVTGMVSLPWSVWTSDLWAAYARLSWRALVARPLIASLSATYVKEPAPAVTVAPKSPQADMSNSTLATPPYAPTTHIGGGCATASQLASIAATIPTTRRTTTTEAGASASMSRGEQTAQLISRILSRLTDGIDPSLSLTELMSTGVTSRVISVSSGGVPTATTCDVFETCRPVSKSLRPVYDIANVGPRNRFTVLTDEGAFIVHNCGYQGGLGAFRKMGGSHVEKMDDEAIQEIVWAWRKAHPRTKALWYDVEAAAKAAIREPGISTEVRELLRFDVIKDGDSRDWLRMRLPSGRYLCYLRPQIDEDSGQILYEGMNQYTRKWSVLETYGGKLCIAGGTLVLTDGGWLPIEHITTLHKLWDGVEWVANEGLVRKGIKEVINMNGVWMTPDHEVLTTEGWISASQSEGLERADPRIPHGCEVPRQRWSPVTVVASLPMRQGNSPACVRDSETTEARRTGLVRLHEENDYSGEETNSRDVEAQSLRGLAQHARPLHATDAPIMAQLRGAWRHGLQGMAALFSKLLGGHGADVSRGSDVGAKRQFRRVWPDELRMGNPVKTGAEQKNQRDYQHAVGTDDSGRSGGSCRLEPEHVVLSGEQRGAGSSAFRGTRYITEVYDLVNCGPRRRFVVAGETGETFIVHNCENAVQAIARDVFFSGMRRAMVHDYFVVLRVHDELVCEVPDEPEYTHEKLAEFMSTNPSWAAGLPLSAAGFTTYRYRKD